MTCGLCIVLVVYLDLSPCRYFLCTRWRKTLYISIIHLFQKVYLQFLMYCETYGPESDLYLATIDLCHSIEASQLEGSSMMQTRSAMPGNLPCCLYSLSLPLLYHKSKLLQWVALVELFSAAYSELCTGLASVQSAMSLYFTMPFRSDIADRLFNLRDRLKSRKHSRTDQYLQRSQWMVRIQRSIGSWSIGLDWIVHFFRSIGSWMDWIVG